MFRRRLGIEVEDALAQRGQGRAAASGPAFNGKGRQEVFLVDGGGARKVAIDVGLADGDSVEILSGAHAGDKLIASDMSRYRDLQSIRISD